MFQTSFDGGDIASITSVFDNENKKPITGILKTKRNSIKRKVQNFSLESDDGVIEPLLQKVKETTEIGNQSAKNLLLKTKTESITEKGDDKDKLLADKKTSMASMTSVPSVTNSTYLVNGTNSVKVSMKSNGSTIMPINTHMYTNVCINNDVLQGMYPPKSQILVEFESTKQLSGYSPSPLIFTTAKIHTDGKSKQMEPVQVTPVPILSTIEGNVIKTGAITDYTTGVNETFRRDNEQNKQDNIFSKNQVSSTPFSNITNNISSDAVTNKSSGNKVIASSTLVQVSQAPKITDVIITGVKSVPLTPITNITQSALHKNEQSTKASIAQIQETAKPTTINVDPKIALGKMTPLMNNTKTDNSIVIPITSRASCIHKTDNMPKVIEMDINKNIQSPKTTSPEPGTSNQVDSISNAKTIPDSFGTDRISRQASSSLIDKKIQSQKHEPTERCFEPDNKQTVSNSNKTEKSSSSKVNSDRNLASNNLNLKSFSAAQSTAKSITPSITTAVSSVVSSIACSESSQFQPVATMSKAITITKDSPASVAKSLATNDTVTSLSNAVKIMTTSAKTNVPNSDKTQTMASTYPTGSASAVSKHLIVSTVKTPAVTTTSQSSTTARNTKCSVTKPLITNTSVAEAMLVKVTTTGANSSITNTLKSQSVAETKTTCSVSASVSKPFTVSTKTPVITSQTTPTTSQASSKTITTSVKSIAAPRMSQASTAKIVAGGPLSTATKPSTVTTMKSSAGQKVNTSTTSKLATPKSAAAVVCISTTIKKGPNEQNDKKASDGFPKNGKGSKA